MRKLGSLLGLMLVLSLTAAAQDAPKAEIFGGYSYVRFNPGSITGISGQNLNGASGSVSFNAKPAFGIVMDFGGYRLGNIAGSGLSANVISYLFGPRIVARGARVEPFIQVLFGGTRISGAGVGASDSAFAMTFGGGMDLKASTHVAIRLIQAEYLMTRFDVGTGSATRQNNARISTGIVFRIGG